MLPFWLHLWHVLQIVWNTEFTLQNRWLLLSGVYLSVNIDFIAKPIRSMDLIIEQNEARWRYSLKREISSLQTSSSRPVYLTSTHQLCTMKITTIWWATKTHALHCDRDIRVAKWSDLILWMLQWHISG